MGRGGLGVGPAAGNPCPDDGRFAGRISEPGNVLVGSNAAAMNIQNTSFIAYATKRTRATARGCSR
jgi:hypothetical protein